MMAKSKTRVIQKINGIVTGLIILFSFTAVNGDVSENFNSYSPGQSPLGWLSLPANYLGGAGLGVHVKDTGDNCLRITSSNKEIETNYYMDETYNGKVTIQYDLLYTDTSSLQRMPVPSYNLTPSITAMISNGQHFAFSGFSTNPQGLYYLSNRKPNTWYKIRFVLNFAIMRYNVFVDDTSVSQLDIGGNVMPFINGLYSLTSGTDLLIDNLSVTQESGGEITDIRVFSNDYYIDTATANISKINYATPVTDFIKSITTLSGTSISIHNANGEKTDGFIEDGDFMEATNEVTQKNYSLTVRKPSLSRSFNEVFRSSIILKKGSDDYYVNSEKLKLTHGARMSLANLSEVFGISLTYDESTFEIISSHNGNYFYNNAPTKIIDVDGYREKVLEHSLEETYKALTVEPYEYLKALGFSVSDICNRYVIVREQAYSSSLQQGWLWELEGL